MHRAGAALAVVTTFFRAGKRNGLADAIQQGRARVDAKMTVLAVDAQRDRDGALNVGTIRDWRRRATLCGTAVRAHWRASSNNCGGRSASHRAQKCPARWIRWVVLFMVVHTQSLQVNNSGNKHYLQRCSLARERHVANRSPKELTNVGHGQVK